MNNFNRLLFLGVIVTLLFIIQLNIVDFWGVVPNLMLAVFAATSVFYSYQEKILWVLPLIALLFILSLVWARFWVLEIIFVALIPTLFGSLAKIGTRNFLIDLPVLVLASTLIFYGLTGALGWGSFGVFVLLEIIYNICVALLFYLLVDKLDHSLEAN